jgi:hypothetical protein
MDRLRDVTEPERTRVDAVFGRDALAPTAIPNHIATLESSRNVAVHDMTLAH